jgi:hypothetical protein
MVIKEVQWFWRRLFTFLFVGINTAIASATGSYSGYSFAIPSSIVRKVAEDLVAYGRVQRAFLGVQVEAARDAHGVVIQEITPGSGAAEADLERGDVLVAVQGKPVSSFAELQDAVARFHVAQAHVVALHGLLCVHQALLQSSHDRHVAAQHQDQAGLGHRQSHVLQWHVSAARYLRAVVDVAPTQLIIGFDGHHFGPFGLAVLGHGFRPRPPHPTPTVQGRPVAARQRHLLNHTRLIQQQGNVGADADQLRQSEGGQWRNLHKP